MRTVVVFSLVLSACAVGPAADDLSGRSDKGELESTWETLFNAPQCREYAYLEPLLSEDEQTTLTLKPKNTFCTFGLDAKDSEASSPAYVRLRNLLGRLAEGDELVLSFMSITSSRLGAELCRARREGASIEAFVDETSSSAVADCLPTTPVGLSHGYGRHGYNHVKMLLLNPTAPGPSDPAPGKALIAVSSGQLSRASLSLNGDAWTFITVPRGSALLTAHRCVIHAFREVKQLADASEEYFDTASDFNAAIARCRGPSPTGERVRTFVFPTDGIAAEEALLAEVEASTTIDIVTHRFAHAGVDDPFRHHWSPGDETVPMRGLAGALAARAPDRRVRLRVVADDDLYWTLGGQDAGLNKLPEAQLLEAALAPAGDRAEVRYAETSDGTQTESTLLESPVFLRHGFIVFRDAEGHPRSVYFGTGQLTDMSFRVDLGLGYLSTEPSTLAAFDARMTQLWNGPEGTFHATPRGKMPQANSLVEARGPATVP